MSLPTFGRDFDYGDLPKRTPWSAKRGSDEGTRCETNPRPRVFGFKATVGLRGGGRWAVWFVRGPLLTYNRVRHSQRVKQWPKEHRTRDTMDKETISFPPIALEWSEWTA
jgi:hypothetical protein